MYAWMMYAWILFIPLGLLLAGSLVFLVTACSMSPPPAGNDTPVRPTTGEPEA